MKKKFLAMLVCVAMMLTLLPTMAFAVESTQTFEKVDAGTGFVDGKQYVIAAEVTTYGSYTPDWGSAMAWTLEDAGDDTFYLKNGDNYIGYEDATEPSVGYDNTKNGSATYDTANKRAFTITPDGSGNITIASVDKRIVSWSNDYKTSSHQNIKEQTTNTIYVASDGINTTTTHEYWAPKVALYNASGEKVTTVSDNSSYYIVETTAPSGASATLDALTYASSKYDSADATFTGSDPTVTTYAMGTNFAGVTVTPDANGKIKVAAGDGVAVWTATKAAALGNLKDYFKLSNDGSKYLYRNDSNLAVDSSSKSYQSWVLNGTTLTARKSSNDDNTHKVGFNGTKFAINDSTPATITLYKLLDLATCTVDDMNYTGSDFVPVVWDGTTKLAETDYDVEGYFKYDETADDNNYCGDSLDDAPTAPGEYVVKLTPAEGSDYVGEVFAPFAINPRVTYHANGGVFFEGGSTEYKYPDYNTAVTTKDNFEDSLTNGNKVFAGWYEDAACTQSYDFTQKVTANLDLYAKWVDATYTVNVKVTADWESVGYNLHVKLMRGNEVVDKRDGIAAADSTFTGIPADNYTLLVEYTGNTHKASKTLSITVDKDLTEANAVTVGLKDKKFFATNTEKAERDTFIDGLETAFTGDNAPASSVEVTVEAVATETEAVLAIDAAGASDRAEYLDITVKKDSTEQTETDGLLTFTFAFPTEGRKNFVVYRRHDYGTALEPNWQVDELTTTPNDNDECIVVGNNTITVKAKLFSTYAIDYDNVVYYGGGGGGGVSTYTVTCGTGVTADKKTASAGATVTLTVAEGYEDVVVKDKNGKTVAVTEGKDGKFTFKMPASAVTVSVSKAEAPADAVCADFNDVDVDAWSHAGIHYCLEKGMMNGVAADTFAPAATTTRAMIVTMLARLSGYSVNGAGNQWYVPSMEWAVANGVSDGTNMTASITREQLATMLYRYAVEIAKVDVDKFTADTNTLSYEDVFTVSEWANAGVHFCLASGIIGGYEDGTIRPQANATRAEVAKMFMSFCENVLAK